MLGALPTASPNECGDSSGHVCDSSSDILYPYYEFDDLGGAALDVGRNDYYGHPGGWFDVQDSRWLLDPSAQVPVTIRVAGAGIVGTEPDGQACSAVCVTEWDAGTPIQLAAEPKPGNAFAGWAGACTGGREPSCLIDAQPAEVVATFRPVRVLTVAVSGRGTVTGTAVRCARTCRSERLEGERVALRAAAAKGWRFLRWTGACRGTRQTCTVRMAAAARVGAVFGRRS